MQLIASTVVYVLLPHVSYLVTMLWSYKVKPMYSYTDNTQRSIGSGWPVQKSITHDLGVIQAPVLGE
jgi:hypothetical protein